MESELGNYSSAAWLENGRRENISQIFLITGEKLQRIGQHWTVGRTHNWFRHFQYSPPIKAFHFTSRGTQVPTQKIEINEYSKEGQYVPEVLP